MLFPFQMLYHWKIFFKFFLSFPHNFSRCCEWGVRELSAQGSEGVNVECEEGEWPQENSPTSTCTSGSDKANNEKAKCVRWSSSCGAWNVTGHWLLASYFQPPFSQGSQWKDRWWHLFVSEPGDQLGCPRSFIPLLMPWDVLCSSDKIATKKAKYQPERSAHRYRCKKTKTTK